MTDQRSKMQFLTSASMPHLVYKACQVTGAPSNTVYVQHAVAEALSRDLGIPVEGILDALPPPRGRSAPFGIRKPVRAASATNEEVR